MTLYDSLYDLSKSMTLYDLSKSMTKPIFFSFNFDEQIFGYISDNFGNFFFEVEKIKC